MKYFGRMVVVYLMNLPKMLFVLVVVQLLQEITALDMLQSNGELASFKKNVDETPIAIFYYHQENLAQPLRSKMRNILEEAADKMNNNNNVFIKFGMINCVGQDVIRNDIKECKEGRRVFYAYRKDKAEKYDLKTLYNLEAFLGHMLYFIYDEHIGVAQNQKDWEYEQAQEKGNKDIVLMYFRGLGSKEQYHLLNFASGHINSYKFVYSTEKAFAESLGMKATDTAAMWYVACSKDDIESKEPCLRRKYPSSIIDLTAIASFVETWDVPPVSDINEDGSSAHDNMHRLYIFVKDEESKKNLKTAVEIVIERVLDSSVHVRGVLVDVNKHEKLLPDFGINENTDLPTIMLEILDGKHSQNREFEPFSLDEDLTVINIEKFVKEHIQSPDAAFFKAASLYDIQVYKLSDWTDPKENNTKRKILAAACSHDDNIKKLCGFFNYNFRHLVRTMYEADIIDIDYVYVDFTRKPKSAKINAIPALRLYVPGRKEEILDVPEQQRDYNHMLQWVNKLLHVNIQPIPLSGSDFVQLPASMAVDENKENVFGDDNIESLNDDELSKDALLEFNKEFYKDNVEKVTDSTFTKIIMSAELVVVFFQVPWDDRSYLFQTVYAKIRNKLANDSPGSTISTKLVKVDCYSEYHTCTNQKIMMYPSIRVFRNGSHLLDYKGMLDEQNLMKAIRLCQLPALVQLAEHEIVSFSKGTHPMPAAALVHISVHGWFKDENEETFKSYKKFAEKHHGSVLFGYSVGESSKERLKSINEHTEIQAFIRDGKHHTEVFGGALTEEKFNQFLGQVTVPVFGELTATNFPTYKALERPMLLVFTKADSESLPYLSQSLLQVITDLKLNVPAAWMDLTKDVSRNIRRSYIGKQKEKDNIVVVDHKKGEVYAYDGPVYSNEEFSKTFPQWLKNFTDEKLTPTSFLKQPLWKPIREGFDYLHFMDHGVPQEIRQDDEEGEGEPLADKDYINEKASFHGKPIKAASPKDDSGDYYNEQINFDEEGPLTGYGEAGEKSTSTRRKHDEF